MDHSRAKSFTFFPSFSSQDHRRPCFDRCRLISIPRASAVRLGTDCRFPGRGKKTPSIASRHALRTARFTLAIPDLERHGFFGGPSLISLLPCAGITTRCAVITYSAGLSQCLVPSSQQISAGFPFEHTTVPRTPRQPRAFATLHIAVEPTEGRCTTLAPCAGLRTAPRRQSPSLAPSPSHSTTIFRSRRSELRAFEAKP